MCEPDSMENDALSARSPRPTPAKPSLWSRRAEFGGYLLKLLSPRYHWHRFKEDLRASRYALRKLDFAEIRRNRDSLATLFRGRFFACFWLAGSLFGVFGAVIGTGVQVATANPLLALFVTFVGTNLLGTVGLQVVWKTAHWNLYKAQSKSFWGRIVLLERDLLPMQWKGFLVVCVFFVLMLPLNFGIAKVLELHEGLSRFVPMGILAPALDLLIINSPLVRIMGDLFEQQGKRLADHYVHEVEAEPESA